MLEQKENSMLILNTCNQDIRTVECHLMWKSWSKSQYYVKSTCFPSSYSGIPLRKICEVVFLSEVLFSTWVISWEMRADLSQAFLYSCYAWEVSSIWNLLGTKNTVSGSRAFPCLLYSKNSSSVCLLWCLWCLSNFLSVLGASGPPYISGSPHIVRSLGRRAFSYQLFSSGLITE